MNNPSKVPLKIKKKNTSFSQATYKIIY